jgi:hypothetical protein
VLRERSILAFCTERGGVTNNRVVLVGWDALLFRKPFCLESLFVQKSFFFVWNVSLFGMPHCLGCLVDWDALLVGMLGAI